MVSMHSNKDFVQLNSRLNMFKGKSGIYNQNSSLKSKDYSSLISQIKSGEQPINQNSKKSTFSKEEVKHSVSSEFSSNNSEDEAMQPVNFDLELLGIDNKPIENKVGSYFSKMIKKTTAVAKKEKALKLKGLHLKQLDL